MNKVQLRDLAKFLTNTVQECILGNPPSEMNYFHGSAGMLIHHALARYLAEHQSIGWDSGTVYWPCTGEIKVVLFNVGEGWRSPYTGEHQLG